MPIYEYECAGCGHRLEEIQRFSDAPLRKCPDCGKGRLKKLISAAGFRLSGKGWYETDFKNNKQKNLVQKDSAEEKKSKSGDPGADKKSPKSGDVGGEKKPGASANGGAKKTTESSAAKTKPSAAPPAAGN